MRLADNAKKNQYKKKNFNDKKIRMKRRKRRIPKEGCEMHTGEEGTPTTSPLTHESGGNLYAHHPYRHSQDRTKELISKLERDNRRGTRHASIRQST